MSGRRAKALRREFRAANGRAPNPAVTRLGPAFAPPLKKGKKPWRDVVKIAASTMRSGKVVEMFLRQIFSITVLEPSEWRRWKKQNQRRLRV